MASYLRLRIFAIGHAFIKLTRGPIKISIRRLSTARQRRSRRAPPERSAPRTEPPRRSRSLAAPFTPQRSAFASSGGAHKGKAELLGAPAECAPLSCAASRPGRRPPRSARLSSGRLPALESASRVAARQPNARCSLVLFTRRPSKHSSLEQPCLQVRASEHSSEHAGRTRATCSSRCSPSRHRSRRRPSRSCERERVSVNTWPQVLCKRVGTGAIDWK